MESVFTYVVIRQIEISKASLTKSNGGFSTVEAKAKIGNKTKLLGKTTFHVKLLFHLCRVMVFKKKKQKKIHILFMFKLQFSPV